MGDKKSFFRLLKQVKFIFNKNKSSREHETSLVCAFLHKVIYNTGLIRSCKICFIFMRVLLYST